jgi:thermostable 8-oxoguanine DNA glycosylase
VKCRFPKKKAEIVVRNVHKIQERNGIRSLLDNIAAVTGPHRDYRRVKRLMDVRLAYLSSKGARDFLMGQGIVHDAIALDIRVMNVLEAVDIHIPKDVTSNPRSYDRTEAELLEELCKLLGMRGVEFDRIIFNNYDQIARTLGIGRHRRRGHRHS